MHAKLISNNQNKKNKENQKEALNTFGRKTLRSIGFMSDNNRSHLSRDSFVFVCSRTIASNLAKKISLFAEQLVVAAAILLKRKKNLLTDLNCEDGDPSLFRRRSLLVQVNLASFHLH